VCRESFIGATQYQIVPRPDEVNCNVGINDGSKHEYNLLALLKRIAVEASKASKYESIS